MVSVKKAGFTIIEVMLFLAISGLLFVGVIVGTGSAINTQRYRDSVSSLQSILQHQYSEVSNVINDNTDNVCSITGGPAVPRGQSECVVLGRFITTTDGKSISIKNVIGKQSVYNSVSDDMTALQQYNMAVTSIGASTYEVEWGSVLTGTANNNPKGFSMLILRSPLSGVVRTFLNDDSSPTDENHITSLLTTGTPPAALSRLVQLCVDSNGLSANPKMAILIGANSTSESGIQVLGESDQSNLGTRYVCR